MEARAEEGGRKEERGLEAVELAESSIYHAMRSSRHVPPKGIEWKAHRQLAELSAGCGVWCRIHTVKPEFKKPRLYTTIAIRSLRNRMYTKSEFEKPNVH